MGGTDFDSYYYGFGADFFTVGSDGSVIGAISTKSRDFPITDDALDKEYNQRFDTVVFRFNPDSSKLIYSTYLGGLGDDHPNFLFSNYLNTVYLTGATSSDDFPTTPGAYDTTHNGGNDAFVLKMRLLPWAPTNLSAVTGSGYVVLNWTPPNDVGPVPIDNYIIYRGLSSSSLEPIATVGNQTWYNDTTTTNGAIYYYAVRASNRYDTGELSLPLKVFAGAPPSAPENLSARPGDFSVELDWSPPSDTGGFNVINYIVYKGLSEDGLTNFTWLGNVTHHVDADVLNGVEYFYAVSAVSIKGEGMRSGVVSVTPGRPPSPPRELRARAEGAGINLTWLPPEDDGDCPILQYIIYRGGAGDEKAEAGRVESSSLSYLEGPFDDGPAWYYQVTAVNAIGESDRSNEAFAVPNRRPSPPRSLSAAHGSGYIELSWEPPLDDGGSPVTGYNIYRGNQSQSESLVVRLQTPLTVYRDTAPEEGRVNFYYITAMNAVGESAPSARTSILADFTPPVVRILSPANGSWVNTTKVTLKGEASDDCGLRSVELSADGASWSPCEGLLAWVGHVELEDGQREIFARAIDLAGNVNYSALTVNVDTVKPEVRILSPSRDTATRDENATVYGTASDDRFLLRVEASTDGASWSPVDGIFSWSLNLSLRNGRNRVQVRALDAAGNSGYASVNITLDRGAPRITIMAPSDGQRLRASGPALTVRLKGSASDDFGLERVELSSDGKKWVVASGLEVWWGNLTLGPGEHRLRARAIDIAGNIGEADVRVVVEPRTYLFDGLDISLIAISLVVAVVLAGPALMLVRRRRRRGRKVPGP
ncbi:MAG: Ig-like domain-containing protein [Thermoplasmata archaeon]